MSETEQKRTSVSYLRIESGYHGQRIDNFLMNALKGVPKSYIYRILRRGEVRVNKGRKPASYRVQEGDLIRVPPVRVAERRAARPDDRLLHRLEAGIIYQDNRFLLLNKPSGIAVHGGSGLRFGAIEAIRMARPEERELELVHRLDRETSGCLLISRKRSALRILHELMRNNGIDKRYLALLAGSWKGDRVVVDTPLEKNRLQRGERMVRADPKGKPALTRFIVRQRFERCMLVEAELVTGRTHQIRVHAAHLGTPILGDDKYGDSQSNREMRALGLKRLFLHAWALQFRWPGEARDLHFRAPLEPALESLLERLA